jgi:hypothetical protein
MALQLASRKLRKSYPIASAVVRQNSKALELVEEPLNDEESVVYETVRKNRGVTKFASERGFKE